MSYHSRRILPPLASRKRKEMDSHYSSSKPSVTAVSVQNPVSSNRLLAGYMAHEFLTKGTLFDEKFDPAAAPSGSSEINRKKLKPPQQQSYYEIANLLRIGDGAYIPGLVNPTQLARWIQM